MTEHILDFVGFLVAALSIAVPAVAGGLMPPARFFKVLHADGRAYHGGALQWALPNGRPGAWHRVEGPLVPCEHGLHLCRRLDLCNWLGPAIFLAEARGEIVETADKVVVREARLLRRLETWTETSARLFAVACARRALERERTAGREPDARSWGALDVATAYTRGSASQEDLAAAWAAAGAAAWDAARDAARAAAGAAAWDAARAAARDAAWAAAGAAAWDAERAWQTDALMRVLFPAGEHASKQPSKKKEPHP
jgi:hypothetical protein